MTPKNESTQELVLDKSSTPIHPTSNSQVKQQSEYFLNNIVKLPFLPIIIGTVGVLCLVFILGKLINQYDLTSVCVGWNCTNIQNPDTCSTKHLFSLGVGGALGLVCGIGIAIFIPGGAIVTPAIAGLFGGAGVFSLSSLLLNFLVQC